MIVKAKVVKRDHLFLHLLILSSIQLNLLTWKLDFAGPIAKWALENKKISTQYCINYLTEEHKAERRYEGTKYIQINYKYST
jgi:hypothetical protein